MYKNSSDWRQSGGDSDSDDCDEQREQSLQSLLDAIDRVVFFDADIPSQFAPDLAHECLVWKRKFEDKFKKNNERNAHFFNSKVS